MSNLGSVSGFVMYTFTYMSQMCVIRNPPAMQVPPCYRLRSSKKVRKAHGFADVVGGAEQLRSSFESGNNFLK